MKRIKKNDLVKVIAGGQKGKIAKVTSVKNYGISVEFENGSEWSLRFEDVHKVVD